MWSPDVNNVHFVASCGNPSSNFLEYTKYLLSSCPFEKGTFGDGII